jgi:peptidyl-prolyl cis-trans isomerase A (cyclophilin A)
VKKTSRRAVIAGAGALAAAGTASAQVQGQTPPAPPPPPVRPRVLMTTALGPITIELAADKAPITCANFLRYVDAKLIDGQSFYRAMKTMTSPLMGLVQGGADRDPSKRFPPIAHESTQLTGLSHRDGAISMACQAPGAATGDFFICVDDILGYDARPRDPGDNQGFAVFGRVVEGMPVVRAILTSPVSPTKGADWGMGGQMLDPEITIVTVTRI